MGAAECAATPADSSGAQLRQLQPCGEAQPLGPWPGPTCALARLAWGVGCGANAVVGGFVQGPAAPVGAQTKTDLAARMHSIH